MEGAELQDIAIGLVDAPMYNAIGNFNCRESHNFQNWIQGSSFPGPLSSRAGDSWYNKHMEIITAACTH